MSEAGKNANAARLVLTIGTRSIPLYAGAVLDAGDVGVGRPGTPVGRVEPHPSDPDELVLLNISDRPWSVRAADGQQRTFKPRERPIQLLDGRQIDFGGAMGIINWAGVHPAQLVPIETKAMAILARKLFRAANERRLTQDQYDRLHRLFYAYDASGGVWSVSLLGERRWLRWEATRWVEDKAPATNLLIDPKTLAQLQALEHH